MKLRNIITLISIFIFVFLLTGCKKADSSKYSGAYIGILTATDYAKEDVELVFACKNTNKEILYLYDIGLTRVSEGQYNANGEIALKIINLINENITLDIISNTSTTFVFEKDEVTMDMHYNIAGSANTLHIRYIGKK
jgi:uncharacterized lipoprotein YehR (DUF1307 family)